MKKAWGLMFLVLAAQSVALAKDVCETAVVREVFRLEALKEKKDRGYSFDGVGDIYKEDAETYVVVTAYNGECVGGYQFLVEKSKSGKSCKILSTKESDGECG